MQNMLLCCTAIPLLITFDIDIKTQAYEISSSVLSTDELKTTQDKPWRYSKANMAERQMIGQEINVLLSPIMDRNM